MVGKHGHGQRGVNRAQAEEKGGAAAVVVLMVMTPMSLSWRVCSPVARPPTARLLTSRASNHHMH
jgi:hypothetical protein